MLIGELAKNAQVTKESIRHYVSLGLLKPTQTKAGTRIYNEFSETDVERVEYIKLAKSLGFTLKELAPYVELFMENRQSNDVAVAAFEEKLIEIEAKIADLQQIQSRLRAKLAEKKREDSEASAKAIN